MNTMIVDIALAAGAGLCLVISVVLSVAIARQRRAIRSLEEMLTTARDDLKMALDCSRGLADRIRQHDRQLVDATRRLDNIDMVDTGGMQVSKVISLFDQGYTVNDIARICDLTTTEVDLISSIARYRSVA
ncbi:MAG: hypothetical protein H6978_13690 [Gammaproteobacteria bacterium]|nr:hypothetical protein [Gammaproteobacteria bacterium]